MNYKNSINSEELNKFERCKAEWWNLDGPLKTLHAINPIRFDFILKHSDLSGQKRILDVGCGGGILTESLAKTGAFVTGLDAELTAITAAKQHALQEKLAINYICSPLENFEDDSFDLITCMELLEHVDDPSIIFEHAQRLLKPGGLLFVSTINRNLKAYIGAVLFAEYLLSLLPTGTHDYKKFLKPSEIAKLAREKGFTILEYKGIYYNPFTNKASLTENIDVNYVCALQRI